MRQFLCGFLIAAMPCIAPASPIPGADDPALQAAAQAWLRGDDPAATIYMLGEVADAGNIAAQDFLNEIWSHFVPLDFPDLDLEARQALLPPTSEPRPRRSRPYRIEDDELPTFEAEKRMFDAQTFADWRADAELLRAAGMLDELAYQIQHLPENKPHLDIEATLYAQSVFGPDDPIMGTIFMFRGLDQSLQDYRANIDADDWGEHAARWGGDPWSPEMQDAFTLALKENRWSAIRAAGFLRDFPGTSSIPIDVTPQIARWADASNRFSDTPALSEPDLNDLGIALIRDAERTHQLIPLVRNCETYCGDAVASCVAKTAVSDVRRSFTQTRLEPVVSSTDFQRSYRAAQQLLVYSGYAPDGTPRDLPQCLLEPAQAAFLRAFPKRALQQKPRIIP